MPLSQCTSYSSLHGPTRTGTRWPNVEARQKKAEAEKHAATARATFEKLYMPIYKWGVQAEGWRRSWSNAWLHDAATWRAWRTNVPLLVGLACRRPLVGGMLMEPVEPTGTGLAEEVRQARRGVRRSEPRLIARLNRHSYEPWRRPGPTPRRTTTTNTPLRLMHSWRDCLRSATIWLLPHRRSCCSKDERQKRTIYAAEGRPAKVTRGGEDEQSGHPGGDDAAWRRPGPRTCCIRKV